jgi:hypothetical protein
MFAQLATYLILSIPLYHLSPTLKFINISPYQEHDFVLNHKSLLNQLKPNSINILCASIIDKYLNRQNIYEYLSLGEFASYYHMRNKKIPNATNKKSLHL